MARQMNSPQLGDPCLVLSFPRVPPPCPGLFSTQILSVWQLVEVFFLPVRLCNPSSSTLLKGHRSFCFSEGSVGLLRARRVRGFLFGAGEDALLRRQSAKRGLK